jgi:hypothetical protein
MLKLASKFAMDIFPSVIATIIGAYIVNHYINNKAPADPSLKAAAVSSTDPKKANSRSESKPAEKSADLGNIPEPGVRAKGVAEKSIFDKSGADKSGVEKSAEKPAEKGPDKPAEKADKPSETASIPPTAPAEGRRHQPTPREKAASRTAPVTVAPPAEPVVAAAPAPPAENGPDANDLARAAIERLRGAPEPARSQETAHAQEPPRAATAPASPAAPVVMAPALQPLPPPILVSTPPDSRPLASPGARTDDPSRPTPPADIPDPRPPLDLRADAVDPTPGKRPSVADDVISAAKSVFQSVLPKSP